MDEPKAWRDLAERLTQLRNADQDKIYANWSSSPWNDNGDHWFLSGIGDRAVSQQFLWTVERAAILLGHHESPTALFFWLDLLKQESPRFIGGGHRETIVGGVQVEKSEFGGIYAVCLASAEYCYKLETQAIAKERGKWLPVEDTASHPPVPAPSRAISIGDQLEQLRQDCNWSIEELAEAVKLDPTNVSRHLSGTSIPRPKNLRRYNSVFSKQLKKQVHIRRNAAKRS
jgi:ribosome-binding protein aMBF1 (putative translation factor)